MKCAPTHAIPIAVGLTAPIAEAALALAAEAPHCIVLSTLQAPSHADSGPSKVVEEYYLLERTRQMLRDETLIIDAIERLPPSATKPSITEVAKALRATLIDYTDTDRSYRIILRLDDREVSTVLLVELIESFNTISREDCPGTLTIESISR